MIRYLRSIWILIAIIFNHSLITLCAISDDIVLRATTSTDIYEYGDNDRADGGNRVSKNQYNKNKKHKKMKDKYEMKMSGTKSNYKETTTGIYDSSYTGDNDGGDNGKRVAKIKRKKRKNTKECVKCKVRKSEETQLKKCSRCRQPLYCSRKCQKIHWKKKHRYNCVEYSDDSLHDALSPSNPEDCWNKTQTSTSSQMSMRFMSAQACPYDIHVFWMLYSSSRKLLPQSPHNEWMFLQVKRAF
eukprot:102067_1